MHYNEYGGYIEIEKNTGEDMHRGAISLNCGRNCLAYLIVVKEIQVIYLPYFLCSSVENICKKYKVTVKHYHIDKKFRPIIDFELKKQEYLYIVNYFGQISDEEIKVWKKKYTNLIIDNAQAYFQMPIDGVDTLYSCRKYFGVADGAYLYTDKCVEIELGQDYSYNRMRFLMGRYEKGANEFYDEYVLNNRSFRDAPILKMSKLTHNILKGINYEKTAKRRTENFSCLNKLLGKYNMLQLIVPRGAFMYPLYISGGSEIRKQLQNKKIYIPILWPDVFECCQQEQLEYHMALNILPIPVDQRYDEKDMVYLANEVVKCMGF